MSPTPETQKPHEKKKDSFETNSAQQKEAKQKLQQLKSEIERKREEQQTQTDHKTAESLLKPSGAPPKTVTNDTKNETPNGGFLETISDQFTAIWDQISGSLQGVWEKLSGTLGSLAASLGIDRWLPESWKGGDDDDHDHADEEDDTAESDTNKTLVHREITAEVQNVLDSLPKKAGGALLDIGKVRDAQGLVLQSGANDHTPAVHESVAADLIGMALEFRAKTGQPLQLTYCYRDINKQQELYNQLGDISKGGLAAVPGTSPHNCGCALDVDRRSFESGKIGGREGFIRLAQSWNFRPHKKEAWHFDHANLTKLFPRETRIAQTKQLNNAYHA